MELRPRQATLTEEWKRAHAKLLQNVKLKPLVSLYKESVSTEIEGRRVYLPAYVPYIGARYFEYRPRVLCYAINQNLSPHVPWTREWISCWARDDECAVDRLNLAAREGRAIPIRPYAEGFIPLVALLAIRRWAERWGGELPDKIDDVVAATNFVKFSTREDASSSSIPGVWWRECASSYVSYEIQVLEPDIILGFGLKTLAELRLVLNNETLSKRELHVLGCRFPARMASIKARPLSSEESKIWKRDILPLSQRMREPNGNAYHQWKIERFPGYFMDVVASWDCEV